MLAYEHPPWLPRTHRAGWVLACPRATLHLLPSRTLHGCVMADSFLCGLLSPAGMAAGRAAVIDTFEWFTHASPIDHFEAIQSQGLVRAWPGSTEGREEILATLGEEGLSIVCLSPYPKSIPLFLNKGGASLFKMALNRGAIPARVGIDCTFGGTYSHAANMKATNAQMSDADVFLAMVRDREVIVTFDPIPSNVLRVCPNVAPDLPPARWPMLVDVSREDVAIFPPDSIGNVLL